MRTWVLILGLALALRAAGAAQTITITFKDHSVESYPFVAETESNVTVVIYDKRVPVSRTNIAWIQINSLTPPKNSNPAAATQSTLQTVKDKLDSAKSDWQNKLLVGVALFNRWCALVLAVFFMLRATWRYQREGDFAGGHLLVFKIYLGSLAALCVADIAGAGGPWVWVGWLLATLTYGAIYTNHDLAEKRSLLYFWLAVALIVSVIGGIFAHLAGWSKEGLIAGCLLTSIPAWRIFLNQMGRSFSEALRGLEFDMYFSEGEFAEKVRPQRYLPSVLLLRKLRDGGEAQKAWQSARKHLFAERRAFPIWLFAMETAVLHLGKPGTAQSLLKRLIKSRQFSFDEQTVSIGQMQTWMQAKGYDFDSSRFKPLQPAILPSKEPLTVARRLAASGHFSKASLCYRRILQDYPRHEIALIELARLSAQDLKDRPAAELYIQQNADFYSPESISHLHGMLDEWMRLEPRASRPKPWYYFQRRQPAAEQAAPTAGGKLVLTTTALPHNTQLQPQAPGPAALDLVGGSQEDPLKAYVARLEERRASLPPPPPPRDKLDQLIAESRFGTATELFKHELKKKPADFDLWLRFAEVYGLHCGNVQTAERIVEQMDRSRRFSQDQIKLAWDKIKEWHARHSSQRGGW